MGKNFVLLIKLFGARAHVKARGHVQTAFPIEATFLPYLLGQEHVTNP